MRETIIAALLAAGVASGGTYTIVQTKHATEPVVDINPQLRALSASIEQLAALEQQGQAMQAASLKAQTDVANRQLIVERVIARTITGADPLPADALPDTPDVVGKRQMKEGLQDFNAAARAAVGWGKQR
jgi:hypothetical protein